MTAVRFSSSGHGAYVAETPLLTAIEERLLRSAIDHGGREIETRATAEYRIGANGTGTARAPTLSGIALGDGREIASVETTLSGVAPDGAGEERFHLSLQLTPGSSDFLYATGPAALARDAHRVMQAGMAALSARVGEIEEDALAMAAATDPSTVARIRAWDRPQLRADAIVRWGAPALYVVLMVVAVAARDDAVSVAAFVATLAVVAFGIWWTTTAADRRRRLVDGLRDEARRIGVPVAATAGRPVRVIDLRMDGVAAPALVHDPITPLEL